MHRSKKVDNKKKRNREESHGFLDKQKDSIGNGNIGVRIKIVATAEKCVKQYFAIFSNRFQKVVVVVVFKLSCKQDTKRRNGNCLHLYHTNGPAKQ